MKVRIGFGLGTRTRLSDPARFAELVDVLEEQRFDSLWLSERLTSGAPDPLIALAVAAGRTERLKLGTSVLVLPGRNPVVLAKEMATLDRLSGGRFLPAVGLGAPIPAEHGAFGLEREERSPWFDEALGLMRRLWTEDDVTHHGERFDVDGLTVLPKPAQETIDVWLGGRAPSELRRVGRLGDGWLASFMTAEEVGDGWAVITSTAAEHDRSIDPEHLGVMIPYVDHGVPDRLREGLSLVRPGVDPDELVAVGPDGIRERIADYVSVGASKFVISPVVDAEDWRPIVTGIRDATADLET